MRDLMRRHSSAWKGLSSLNQEAHTRQAAAITAAQMAEKAEDLRDTTSDLRATESRLLSQDDLEEAERLNASQCRFSDQDYVRFEGLLNHPDFRASSCGKRMETLMAPPAPPSDKVQDMLVQLEVSGHPKAFEEPRLPWVKAACKHRDHLYSETTCTPRFSAFALIQKWSCALPSSLQHRAPTKCACCP